MESVSVRKDVFFFFFFILILPNNCKIMQLLVFREASIKIDKMKYREC